MPLVLDFRLVLDPRLVRDDRCRWSSALVLHQPVFRVVGSLVGSTVGGADGTAWASSLVALIAYVGQWWTKSPSAGDHSTTGWSGYALCCESIAIKSGAIDVHNVQPMHFARSTVICIG